MRPFTGVVTQNFLVTSREDVVTRLVLGSGRWGKEEEGEVVISTSDGEKLTVPASIAVIFLPDFPLSFISRQ
jgi:hypothetical protein